MAKKDKTLQERVDELAPALMENVRARVSLKLAILRKSRAELCKEKGVSTSAVSNYLNSDNMTMRSLVLVAEMLGVTPAWLLSPTEESEGD